MKRRKNEQSIEGKERLGRIGIGVSATLLMLITLAMLLPSTTMKSQAESCIDNPTIEGCYTTMAETEVGVKARTTIALAISPNVTMEVVPTSIGTISSASTKLGIATNSNDGYALYMQSESETGDLVSIASSASGAIKNTQQQDVTLDDLEKNAYGYALTTDVVNAGTTYSTIPTTGSIIQKTTSVTPTEGNYAYGDTYYLSFGVKVGTDLPAGAYAGSVMISAVANPKTLATMFDLNYMQDMTSDICTNTREGYTKQLIDTRDGKSYWVAKLKDGNCWMTQNLALDITEEGLKASDTDIDEDWNQDSAYPPEKTNAMKLMGSSYDSSDAGTHSWDFGKSLQATPLIGKTCMPNSAKPNISIISGETPGEICQESGFIDVNGEWSASYIAQEGQWKFNTDDIYSGFITADQDAKTYDAHYLIGNYYMWDAATAGSGAEVVAGDAKYSICPKNWKLPVFSTSGSGSFTYLYGQYGMTGSQSVIADFIKAPFYNVFGGLVYRWSGAVTTMGTSGSLISATGTFKNDSFGAKYYNFGGWIRDKDPNIMQTYDNGRDEGRQYGWNVRCLAR